MRRGQGRVLASVVAGACALAALAGVAIAARGIDVRSVDLNDSGVWVTNAEEALIARQNRIAGALDAAFSLGENGAAAGDDFDILQDRDVVIAYDEDESRLVPVDVARGKADAERGEFAVPKGALVAMRGGTLAVLDPATGRVWGTRYSRSGTEMRLGEVSTGAAEDFTLDVGGPGGDDNPPTGGPPPDGAALTVTVGGTIIAVSNAGELRTSVVTDGALAKAVKTTTARRERVALTAVGEQPVIIDMQARTAAAGANGTPQGIPGTGRLMAQEPGPERADALIATSDELLAVPMAGTAPRRLFAATGGRPAAPLVLGDCRYAAWGSAGGDAGTVAGACGAAEVAALPYVDRKNVLTTPVFRHNRGQIVLNDVSDGDYSSVDGTRSVDNWDQFVEPSSAGAGENPKVAKPDPGAKPTAEDDSVQARAGRQAVVHVLDNDDDPSGRILAIRKLNRVIGGSAAIASDGQSLSVLLDKAGALTLDYTIDNGRDEDTATLTVATTKGNTAPQRREIPERQWTVVAGGRIVLPVIDEWRDKEGDPIAVEQVRTTTGDAHVTQDGASIEFAAPADAKPGQVTLTYAVTDGEERAERRVAVQIPDPDNDPAVAPITRPDMARGSVGRPISIFPLANDLPGVDPSDAAARLTLRDAALADETDAAAVPDLEPDTQTGRVTMTAAKAGTYFVTYETAYGAVPTAPGRIRIDVAEPPTSTAPPVAMPDDAVIRGANAVTIDVLNNDVDPGGGLLTVTSAESPSAALEVTPLSGRWVRVAAGEGLAANERHIVRYVVSNGARTQTGQIAVTTLPAPRTDPPVTTPDEAAVRAGDWVEVPVLANDSTIGGSDLALLPSLEGATTDGQLVVTDVSDPERTDVGTAYVSGSGIRYLAPARVDRSRNHVIDYVAVTPTGERAAGRLAVTVLPAPGPDSKNRPPAPVAVEARVASGATAIIPIEPTGHDPDGDSTVVVGLHSAPRLGRVLSSSPTSLTYEAYPGLVGTDTFEYLVQDRFGRTAIATITVGVTAPGLPQPPVPLPDSITAAPGAPISLNVLENDLIARGDKVTIDDLGRTNSQLSGGTRVGGDGGAGPIITTAPPAGAAPRVISYAVNGLGGESIPTTLTVRSEAGYQNPPRVYDTVAEVDDSGNATADVLDRAYDPDGDSGALEVEVPGLDAGSVRGGRVTIPVTDQGQTIPFVVTDEAGAAASAVIYVPARALARPTIKTPEPIPVAGRTTLELSELLISPSAADLIVTEAGGSARLWTSPPGAVRASVAAQGRAITVTPEDGYTGPAAVVVAVGTAPDEIGTVVTIPLRVGTSEASLRCPATPVELAAGGQARRIDITALCQATAADPSAVAALSYTAQWDGAPIAGVDIGSEGRAITLRATSAASGGARGTLRIGIVGGPDEATATLSVRVSELPPPSLASVRRDQVPEGEAVRIDLRGYLSSPLPDPDIRVLRVEPAAGAVIDGSAVTLTPPSGSTQARFTVTVGDSGPTSAPGRQASGTIVLDVFGPPDAPTAVVADRSGVSGTVDVRWTPGSANGSPIDFYEVEGGGRTQRCSSSPCLIRGLDVGAEARFRVRAHNAADFSPWSGSSAAVVLDAIPGAVPSFTAAAAGDRRIALSWGAAPTTGSAVDNYAISWEGGSTNAGTALGLEVSVPSNDIGYTFTIVAQNAAGSGPAVSSSPRDVQSAGDPATPTGFTATGDGSGSVRLAWSEVAANGPGPVTYTVTEGGQVVCAGESTGCTQNVALDGASHSYALVATNAAARSSGAASASYVAVGTPAGFTAVSVQATGVSGEATVAFTAGQTNGGTGTVTVTANSAAAGSSDVPAEGGSGAFTLTGLADGSTTSVELRICNEQSRCADSATEQVVTFGPLGAPSLTAAWSADQGAITYDASGSGSGGSATLSVTIAGRVTTRSSGDCLSGCSADGAWTAPDSAYDTTVTVTATITRRSGGSESVSVDVTIPPKPPPPPTPTVSLTGSPLADGTCAPSTQACYAITIAVADFPASVTCAVTAARGESGTPGLIRAGSTIVLAGTETRVWGNFDGYYLKVSCDRRAATWTP